MSAESPTSFVISTWYCTWLNVLCKNLKPFFKVFNILSSVSPWSITVTVLSFLFLFLLNFYCCTLNAYLLVCLLHESVNSWGQETVLFRFRCTVFNVHRFSINVDWFYVQLLSNLIFFFFSFYCWYSVFIKSISDGTSAWIFMSLNFTHLGSPFEIWFWYL